MNWAILIGAFIAGAVCGLLPLWMGKRNDRESFGLASLIICILSGLILGLLLALPMALILTAVIANLGKPRSAE